MPPFYFIAYSLLRELDFKVFIFAFCCLQFACADMQPGNDIKAMRRDSGIEAVVDDYSDGGESIELPRQVRFVDATEEAGIGFVHTSGMSGRKYGVETIGSGAAFFDYDRDGWMDLYVVNGGDLPGYVSTKTPRNALYHNEGGRFVEVGKAQRVADVGYGMGVSAGDFDNDGDADLFVANFGRNAFYRNEGADEAWVFSDITEDIGLGADQSWSTGSSFVDFDLDGDVDLYVANYLDFEFAEEDMRVEGGLQRPRRHLAPTEYPGRRDFLFRNEDGEHFADVTEAVGLLNLQCRELGAVFFDYDLDGDADLFQGNDATPNFLFRNDNGRFVEVGLFAGVAYNEGGKPEGTMGVDVADIDGDGHLDLAMTNFQWESNTLYRNQGNGLFKDASMDAGLGATSLARLAFGINFLDVDLDGDQDLYVANGHIDEDIDRFDPQATYGQLDQLYLNDGGGRFTEVGEAAGLDLTEDMVGRGSAVADYDNDGDADILLVNTAQRAVLLRNETVGAGHWLALDLQGRTSNRDGYGARVVVEVDGRVMTTEKRSAASYLSQNDARLLFGLGSSEVAERVVVSWPSGIRQELLAVRGGQVLKVVEPADSAQQKNVATVPIIAEADDEDGGELVRFWQEAPMILPTKTQAALPPLARSLAELRATAESRSELPAAHIDLAGALLRERLYSEAESSYHRALSIGEDSALAWVGLGRLYADQGDLGRAIEALDKAIAIDGALAEPHYLLGNIRLRQQRLEMAVLSYESAITLQSDYLQAYFNLGGLHARQTDYGPAADVLRRGLAAMPRAVELMFQLARVYFAQAQYDQALNQLTEVVAVEPDRAEAHELIAQIHLAKEDAVRAEGALRTGLQADSTNAALQGRLGILLMQEGQVNEAVDLLQRALYANPDRGEVYYSLGQALVRRGQEARGRKLLEYFRALQGEHQKLLDYKTAVVLNPNDADAYYNLGAVYARIGRYHAASQAYQAALVIAPDHLNARNNLGNIYLRRRELGLAIAAYRAVLQRDPDYVRAHHNLGNAYVLQGEQVLAVAAFEKAVATDPEYRKARQMLAQLYRRQGRTAEADALEVAP